MNLRLQQRPELTTEQTFAQIQGLLQRCETDQSLELEAIRAIVKLHNHRKLFKKWLQTQNLNTKRVPWNTWFRVHGLTPRHYAKL